MSDWAGLGTIIVAPNDVAGMAAAIKTMALQPDFALAMGRVGQHSMAQRPSPIETLDCIHNLYTQTTKHGR